MLRRVQTRDIEGRQSTDFAELGFNGPAEARAAPERLLVPARHQPCVRLAAAQLVSRRNIVLLEGLSRDRSASAGGSPGRGKSPTGSLRANRSHEDLKGAASASAGEMRATRSHEDMQTLASPPIQLASGHVIGGDADGAAPAAQQRLF